MKTPHQILKNRDQLMKHGQTASESEKRSIRKKLAFLHPIILYMEHSPLKESIERQLDEISTKQRVINEQFSIRYPNGCDTKTKSKWMESKGMKDMKKQAERLRYILSDAYI